MNLGLNENRLNIGSYGFREAEDFILSEIKKSVLMDVLNFGRATLVLTGGRTIRYFLPSIAALDVPWGKITISLTDDRLVATDSKHSNEGFLLRNFLNTKGPSQASFVSLKNTYFKNKTEWDNLFLKKISPLSFVLLSMGNDGHIASIFPDDEATLNSSDPIVMTQRVDFKRVSLSIPTLLQAGKRCILVFGQDKCDFFDKINFEQFSLSRFFKESCVIKVIDSNLYE